MEEAAMKELQRMLNAGMLEPISGYCENLSRGFFVEKPGKDTVKARLVADFRGINRKLRRPEHPLEGSWGILKVQILCTSPGAQYVPRVVRHQYCSGDTQ